METILMVDDDTELCTMVAEYLAPEELRLEAARDGETGLTRARSGEYSLLILDVMLPKIGGFEILRRLREAGVSTPVLMLTARGNDEDRITGLELGADDYLPKPFNPRELAARIKAILRRVKSSAGAATEPATREQWKIGDLEADSAARVARRNGRALDLTSAEFDLLTALLREAGRIVSREQLAQEVFGRKLLRLDRTVDMHVSNLRKKVGDYPNGQERIVTVRGSGYMLALPTTL
jgi:two-component system response regulator CpxR